MVEAISKLTSANLSNTLQASNIEQHPAWRPHLLIGEISELLKNQKPYTYIISPLAPDIFLLSFVRDEDQSILHIQFDRTKDNQWHYLNGIDNIAPTLKEIIRKMMHLEDTMPDPTPLC